MRHQGLLTVVLLVLAAGAAEALVAEVWARRSLRFSNLGRAEVSATATGLATLNGSAGVSSQLSSFTIGFNPDLAVTQSLTVTDSRLPYTRVIPDFQSRPDLQGGGVIGNISGALASGAGGLTPDTIPLTGSLLICLLVAPLPPCLAQLPLVVGGTDAGSFVGHGIGGILTLGGTGEVRISLIGAPYTLKTVTVVQRTANGGLSPLTARGFAHGPASLTGSTAASSGVVQIVAPTHIATAAILASGESGQISTLTLHVVPEPRLLLLLGGGAAALAFLGGWRRRSRS